MKTLLLGATVAAAIAEPAQAFNLTPTSTIGNARTYAGEPYFYLSSGAQARNIRTLNQFLGFQMPYGVGGSAAVFDLAPGRYSMTWRLQTNPNEFSDELFLWNGALMSLASSFEADQWHEDGSYRLTTEWRTTEFESFGRIILIALDGQRRYDTTLKVESIAAVPEPTAIGGLVVAGFYLVRRGRQR